MSDYEMINIRVAEKMAARRKDALKRLACVLALVLVTVLAWVGLEWIGFISKDFLMILASVTICAGSFQCGGIWNSVKR